MYYTLEMFSDHFHWCFKSLFGFLEQNWNWQVIKKETDPIDEVLDNKTVLLLQNEPKKALRSLGSVITDAKEIHKDSKDKKFSGDLHLSVHNLLPTLAREFRRVEKIALGECSDEAEIKCCAKSLDNLYEDFGEIEEISNKLCDKKKRARAAR